MKRVLVAGATGYLGRYVVKEFKKQGFWVRGLARNEKKLEKLNEYIDEKKMDIVLVPMLCFDEKGFRVGYGKGFYDKFLSLCREDCLKIGLSLFPPIQKIENVEDYDVKLDFCITPNQIYNFTKL